MKLPAFAWAWGKTERFAWAAAVVAVVAVTAVTAVVACVAGVAVTAVTAVVARVACVSRGCHTVRMAETPNPRPVRFGIVGTGWRSEFFVRMARAVPEALEVALVVGRRQESTDRIAAKWGVPTSLDIADFNGVDMDFVATALPKPANPEAITELAAAGHFVLAETPPAPDLDGLRKLWSDVVGADAADGASAAASVSRAAGAAKAGGGAAMLDRIQVAEQCHRMPTHESRLSVLDDGVIGARTGVEVSSTHMYHAVALIRRYLGVGITPVTATGRTFGVPLVDPADRSGYREDADLPLHPAERTLAMLDFGEGLHGVYDFVSNQWHNPLIANRVVVRGTTGELVDDRFTRWHDGVALTSQLEYRRLGVDMDLEGLDVAHVSFDGDVVWRNPFVGARLSDDDLAVAVHLYEMGLYARGEADAPYPLRDGLHDHAIALAIMQSAAERREVSVEDEPWMDM